MSISTKVQYRGRGKKRHQDTQQRFQQKNKNRFLILLRRFRSSVRSFAFRSIQDQRAELERRRGFQNCCRLRCLLHATVFTIPQTNVLHLQKSASPPLSPFSFGKRLFGLLRKFLGLLSLCVLFGFKFLVSSYKKKVVKPAPSPPHFAYPFTLFRHLPFSYSRSLGFGVSKEVFLGIKLPQLGILDRRLAFG